jgi:hypothetical protein
MRRTRHESCIYPLAIGFLRVFLPMCAVRKSVLLINAGRFSLAAALALVITAGAPEKVDSSSSEGLDLTGLVGNVVLTLLGINDALAAPPPPSGGGGGSGGGGSGGGSNTGGFQSGCSSQLASNNANSVNPRCERIAVFTLCESKHSGEPGREIVVLANGLTAINKIRCD